MSRSTIVDIWERIRFKGEEPLSWDRSFDAGRTWTRESGTGEKGMSDHTITMCPELWKGYGYCILELGHEGNHVFPSREWTLKYTQSELAAAVAKAVLAESEWWNDYQLGRHTIDEAHARNLTNRAAVARIESGKPAKGVEDDR